MNDEDDNTISLSPEDHAKLEAMLNRIAAANEARVARIVRAAEDVARQRNDLWALAGPGRDAIIDADTVAASAAALSVVASTRTGGDDNGLPLGWHWAVDTEGLACAYDGDPELDDTISVYYEDGATFSIDGLGCDAGAPDEVHEAVKARNAGREVLS